MDEGNNIFCESWIVYRVLYTTFILRTSISSVNNVVKSWLTVSHKLNFANEIKAINLIDASSWWKLVQLQILEDYNATVCGIFIKTTK